MHPLSPVVRHQVKADRPLQETLGREEVLLFGLQQGLLRFARPEEAPEEMPPEHQQKHQAQRPSHAPNLGQHQRRRRYQR